MIEWEFYIKKLQDLEAVGDWKEHYLHIYEKVFPMIDESHYLRRNFYLKELDKDHKELMDLPYAMGSGDKLKFRKLQKSIIDLLYQIQEETKKIFVVCGADSHMVDKVTSFLGKLRLDYVVLEDRQKERRMKDFKQVAKECGYALILFSGDDVGRSVLEGNEEKVRASQKVIFQVGFFLSHVGRKNMILLYSEDKEIESPFDFDDLIYAPFDSKGNWKMTLVKEMEEAGIYVEKSLAGI